MVNTFPSTGNSAVEAVNSLIAYAVVERASDVHYDPRSEDVLIRLRVDGQMIHGGTWSKVLHNEIISRLKILAGARTDIHAVPQDGRWGSDIAGMKYQIRISFMPTYHGENAVLRILPVRRMEEVSFSSLGFTPDHVRQIDIALQRTSGLILVTGPTGSGKTTTLHACLVAKASQPLSLLTLEDPVEYEIPQVRQIHIRHTHGVTFASGLRSALRQDPDVIMVGEIRDAETAHVAIHTALTGHLVLSTLHTTSALEAIPRLVDMGIDSYLLASTLRLIIAQRLVRVLCRICIGEGCEACRMAGYSGRSVMAEVCSIDVGMKKLIMERRSHADMDAYARSQGFVPMAEDGYEKVEWGVTSDIEILRVLYE